jgi:hypothetical protein
MLIDAFATDSLILLAVILGGGALSLLLAILFLQVLHRRLAGEPTRVPVAPFFASVTTIWALIFGFVAAEVWQTNNRATEAALAERSSIQRLAGIAAPDALDLPQLRRALAEYVIAVAEDEWGRDANSAPHARADAAVQGLRLNLIVAAHGGMPEALVSKMIVDFDELQDARELRLAIGQRNLAELKWTLVVVLAVLSQISIAFVHRDRPRAGRVAIGIFTIAACLSIWLVALHATPYSGSVSITEAHLTDLF